jgi:Tannase and feruloyl esterase
MTDSYSPPSAVARKSIERVRPGAGRLAIVSLGAIAAGAPLGSRADAAPAGCAALSTLELEHARVVAANEIAGGAFVAPDQSRHEVTSFCRVQVEARPTADSQIRFEIWMPAHGWNGRYYQLGNGGFAGTVPYELLAAELRRGNAVAATDTGHVGDAFDASWARGHPERIIDYGWRSLQETSDAAREVVRAFYGRDASNRYFVGCSNGGRQALVLAQRFPADWDGILAGAPALNWTRQLAAFAGNQRALNGDPSSSIDAATLPVIQRFALAACKPEARVVDGVPTDPRNCRVDPDTHICGAGITDGCLTSQQAAALTQIQDGPRDARTGALLYYGFEATSAAVTGNWEQWIVNDDRGAHSQRTLGEQFFRNMVFADSSWRIEQFDPARDFDLAQRTEVRPGQSLEKVLNASDPDLTAFARHGAKLLMYFGWADAVISPRAAVAYYEAVVDRSGGIEATQKFFRLFMAPGMTHCQGGPAPHVFGQSALTPGLRDDPAHDARRALEAWVENGRAPTRLVAAKYVNDDPAQGIAKTGVLCPFPATHECLARSLGEP